MDEEILDWLDETKTFSVAPHFDDDTPTQPLKVKPGDTDSITAAAQQASQSVAHKMRGREVRAAVAQIPLLMGWMLAQGVISLKQYDRAMGLYKQRVDERMQDVEQRMTTQELTYRDLIKALTEADTGEGAAEVISARNSNLYGEFATLDARFEHLESLVGGQMPGGFDVTIAHGAGRTPASVIVDYYTDALGTETNGLGTSPLGLGGSDPLTLQTSFVTPDANTVTVTLPVIYQQGGAPELHADGYWYLIDENKTLRFKLLGSDGKPIASDPKATAAE